jgi:hypothetical protein
MRRIGLVGRPARRTQEKKESQERERTQPNQEDAGHSVLLRESLIWLKPLSSPLSRLRKAAYSLAKPMTDERKRPLVANKMLSANSTVAPNVVTEEVARPSYYSGK